MLKKKTTITMSHKATITSRVSYMKESLVDFWCSLCACIRGVKCHHP